MDTDRLSIVVPIHGQIETTLKFIDSFDRQTVKCPLVFIDDRSPDDSVPKIRARGHEVRVLESRTWYNAVIQGEIDNCQTEFLAILGNDLVLPKDYVERLLEAFDESGYDMLVPKTVDLDEQDYLDARREYRVTDLLQREGWCVAFRAEKFQAIPKIPSELLLWHGDSWMFHHANIRGYKLGKMEHVRVFHAESTTIKATDCSGVIKADNEFWRTNFPWIRINRLPPNKKPPERFGLDPASKKLLRIEVERGEDDDPEEVVCTGNGWPHLAKHPVTKSLGSVVICLPVSPLHVRFIDRFRQVVEDAWNWSHGPFSSMKIEVVLDYDGKGAGWGRNQAVERNPDADWYFFVDVDDLPKPFCFEAMNYAQSDVVWGVIEHRKIGEEDVYLWVSKRSFEPYEWDNLVSAGHRGGSGLNNAFFIRGSIARRHRWFENLFAFEDIEYFIVAGTDGTFEKLPFPLVTIDRTVSKPADSPGRPRRDMTAVGFTLRTFWQRYGRQPLSDETAAFRNSVQDIREFYG